MDHHRSAAAAAEVSRLIEVMASLRAEEGCPWDRKQSWRSLRRHVLEEAYELVDAVERNDPDAVCEECGDLLLEVVFMAQIAHEEGRFGMAEVARGIADKLIRRHPHVFGDESRTTDSEEALSSWEAVKARENPGREAGPRALPALLLALKVLERRGLAANPPTETPGGVPAAFARMEAARAGGGRDALEAALGDLLLAVTRDAHREGLDPEAALRGAAGRLHRGA